jgi:hypothetical protein
MHGRRTSRATNRYRNGLVSQSRQHCEAVLAAHDKNASFGSVNEQPGANVAAECGGLVPVLVDGLVYADQALERFIARPAAQRVMAGRFGRAVCHPHSGGHGMRRIADRGQPQRIAHAHIRVEPEGLCPVSGLPCIGEALQRREGELFVAGHVHLQRVRGGVRAIRRPERLDELVRRDDLVRVHEEDREQGSLLPGPQGDLTTVRSGLERSQDSELQRGPSLPRVAPKRTNPPPSRLEGRFSSP